MQSSQKLQLYSVWVIPFVAWTLLLKATSLAIPSSDQPTPLKILWFLSNQIGWTLLVYTSLNNWASWVFPFACNMLHCQCCFQVPAGYLCFFNHWKSLLHKSWTKIYLSKRWPLDSINKGQNTQPTSTSIPQCSSLH